jgi:hypothetical protein
MTSTEPTRKCSHCGDRGKKAGRGSPKKLDPRIIPDEGWPGMFRLLLPDGSLTDMVNLTRAKDALAVILDDGAA